ncbi:DMT family transporter [Thalassobaculum sp.]|uniref:DMT family transporter n=1 Tax=Thalassobaculum sp. TaxID=2022740 RepID=UPI0032EAF10B
MMCVAFLLFTFLDTSAKLLAQEMGSLQIVWARFVGHAVLVAAILLPRKGTRVLASSNLKLQILRSVFLFLSTVFNFFALRYLHLATTASIMFTVPLLVAALSVPLLSEQVGWRRWTAIAVGFIGVLIIVRPTGATLHWAIGLSLFNAVSVALYQITTRKLAARDHSDTTSLYSPLFGALILLPLLPFICETKPGPLAWALLCAMGLFGGIGHWLLIIAHRYAPASLLAPFSYTGILWMTTSGFLVFGHLPDEWTVVGAAVVIASGLYVFHRERIRKTGA